MFKLRFGKSPKTTTLAPRPVSHAMTGELVTKSPHDCHFCGEPAAYRYTSRDNPQQAAIHVCKTCAPHFQAADTEPLIDRLLTKRERSLGMRQGTLTRNDEMRGFAGMQINGLQGMYAHYHRDDL